MNSGDASTLSLCTQQYLSQAVEKLQWVARQQAQQIAIAGAAVARAIANGGLWRLFGTGHSHMLAEEVFYRAGGLVPVAPILESSLMLHESALQSTALERLPGLAQVLFESQRMAPPDVLLIASNSGRNAVPVEMARLAKQAGIYTIAITSLEHSAHVASRDASGLRLYEVVDLAIDNGAPYGDALIEIPGHAGRMGPISTVTGAAIVNAIAVEAAVRLKSAGINVPTLVSANVDESCASLEEYRKLGGKVRHV